MKQPAFDGHALWQNLERVESALATTEAQAGPDEAESRGQLRSLIAYTRSFRKGGHLYLTENKLREASNLWGQVAAGLTRHEARWAADYVDALYDIFAPWLDRLLKPPADDQTAARTSRPRAGTRQKATARARASKQPQIRQSVNRQSVNRQRLTRQQPLTREVATPPDDTSDVTQ